MDHTNLADRPIGIFDSGIGGLTVLRELHRQLPAESTIYLGDTARVPYGIRSPETVKRYSLQNSMYLMEMGVKLLIIACNTSSAISLYSIRNTLDIPVLGVIEPGAKAAVTATRNGTIGVIGTEVTIKSGAYRRAIHSHNGGVVVYEQCCPLFVPLVEEGWLNDEITEAVARKYLNGLIRSGIDTLVLGCTHYPLLKGVLTKVMGEGIVLIDSGIEKAKNVKNILKDLNLLKRDNKNTFRKYYVTDSPERFIAVGRRFLGEPIEDITSIELTSLEMAI
ncbi:MAG: glutamate racemase [Nitrospirae bacterium]|uniref:glutamate racemase n=1 Tax=Candidatus Magnetobacterium casense TaxID=1455061 RepID=UPI00058F313C|nr:glutamate racemase [Candidatus Magnetobacterium casensis]MBF0336987.1 glutamate racemase [Nitrospirota bacterium]